jgi:hypothetical protein
MAQMASLVSRWRRATPSSDGRRILKLHDLEDEDIASAILEFLE